MKTPTDAELAKYEDMLEKVRVANLAGVPDEQAEADLKAYMVETGIADEAPVSEFPEIMEEYGKM